MASRPPARRGRSAREAAVLVDTARNSWNGLEFRCDASQATRPMARQYAWD